MSGNFFPDIREIIQLCAPIANHLCLQSGAEGQPAELLRDLFSRFLHIRSMEGSVHAEHHSFELVVLDEFLNGLPCTGNYGLLLRI
ncbi:hypothetical protein D3C81_1873250 [compost metagenome]